MIADVLHPRPPSPPTHPPTGGSRNKEGIMQLETKKKRKSCIKECARGRVARRKKQKTKNPMLIWFVCIRQSGRPDAFTHVFLFFSGYSSFCKSSHHPPTVTQRLWAPAKASVGLHQAAQCFPFPEALASLAWPQRGRVYVLCNCRPQSEQEASVCQNRPAFPSGEA